MLTEGLERILVLELNRRSVRVLSDGCVFLPLTTTTRLSNFGSDVAGLPLGLSAAFYLAVIRYFHLTSKYTLWTAGSQ